MIAEAIGKLLELFQQGNKLVIHKDRELRKAYVQFPAGDVHEEAIPAPDVEGRAETIADLLEIAKDTAICPAPEVWYGHDEVSAVRDRRDRSRGKIRMSLPFTQQWSAVESLVSVSTFSQKELIRFLRYELTGCVADADTIVGTLRTIDFSRQSSGARTVEHGRESLGRKVEAAVQQRDKIPETLKITAPVYCLHGLKSKTTMTVACGLDMDPEKEQFSLELLAGEWTNAMMSAMLAVGEVLRAEFEPIPVFAGSIHVLGSSPAPWSEKK